MLDNQLQWLLRIRFLVQHLHKEDFKKYGEEVNRVLKPGGHILNVSLSKNTKQFLDFHPSESETKEFQVDGLTYYFFEDNEIIDIYGDETRIINQEYITLPEQDNEVFVITLLQKN